MNGPEHFRAAEELLSEAKKLPFMTANRMAFANEAQVHATLALAAASIEDMESDQLRRGWAEIVDVPGDTP